MKKVILITLPIVIGLLTFIVLNNFLDKNLDYLLKTKDISKINNEYGNIYKDKGVEYNNYISKNIIIEATSELNVPIPENPSKFFPIKGVNNVTTIGRQACQSLTLASILASQNNDYNENKKLALIVSLQWFYNKDGVFYKNFQGNFSPLQFYKVLENEKISDEHKTEYVNRVDSLLTGSSEFLPEKIYAKLYSNKNIVIKLASKIFEPYFFVRKKMLDINDKGILYKKLIALPEKQEEEPRSIDWKAEYKKAEKQGKSKITNNNLLVNDDYYNKNKSKMDTMRKQIKNRDLENSKEFDDLKLYLGICKDLGLKPYVIIMPTNGKWYDALGLKQEERKQFFDNVEKIVKDIGFEVLNFKDEEYTPYFMYDAAHFGWKGWLEVDEELYKHFKN